MSEAQWFWAVIGGEAVIVAVTLWFGIRHQVNRFGAYVEQGLDGLQRGKTMLRDGENLAIQFRAIVAFQKDLTQELHTGRPILPPDAFPDPVQEKEVA